MARVGEAGGTRRLPNHEPGGRRTGAISIVEAARSHEPRNCPRIEAQFVQMPGSAVKIVAACYGILRANAVAVPVNPMNKADEVGHYIVDPETRVFVTRADLAANVALAKATLNKSLAVAHPRFGRSAALQILAIAKAMAVVCALQPIPNRGAQPRGDLFSVALAELPVAPRLRHLLVTRYADAMPAQYPEGKTRGA